MGRKKNPDNKPSEEKIKEKLEASSQVVRVARDDFEEAKAREAFRDWWASARKLYNRPRELEDVLWAHLKKSGHDQPDLYDKGIEHFGLKK